MVAPHAAGKLSTNYRAALVHFDRVLATAKSVLNDALHFEKITLAHETWSESSEEAGTNRAEASHSREATAR